MHNPEYNAAGGVVYLSMQWGRRGCVSQNAMEQAEGVGYVYHRMQWGMQGGCVYPMQWGSHGVVCIKAYNWTGREGQQVVRILMDLIRGIRQEYSCVIVRTVGNDEEIL